MMATLMPLFILGFIMGSTPYFVYALLYIDEHSKKQNIIHCTLSSIIFAGNIACVILGGIQIHHEDYIKENDKITEYTNEWKFHHRTGEYENRPVYNIPSRSTDEIPYYEHKEIFENSYFMLQTNNQLFKLDYKLIENIKDYNTTEVLTPIYNPAGEPVYFIKQ